VLDLACGAGRHLRELASAGVSAVGLDLSRVLLAEARAADPAARLVRGDMRRLPFADGAFGALTSFFTSFGYFASRADDRTAAREMRRVLRPGGSFMLDFFNADRVREELVPRDVREARGRRVIQTRRIVDDTVVKRIRIEELEPGEETRTPRHFHERVRLYSAEELSSLLRAEGLRTERRYGDYDGGEAGAGAERLILVGEAA
ncbi:MAG: class I SAM-dependent methyltransferase, partial [Gemmatimonadota bacterium]